mmetsp:Transcript_35961/g.57499  ORF Transcript_35961/g.57499 Transcript_35961/m.57499 type:complete len:81 (-) Transcript_35961:6763-7005(-)
MKGVKRRQDIHQTIVFHTVVAGGVLSRTARNLRFTQPISVLDTVVAKDVTLQAVESLPSALYIEIALRTEGECAVRLTTV